MHFFRLRIINTILFLVIGILIGFILKGRFYAPSQPAPEQRYHPSYESPAAGPAAAPDESADENPAAEQPSDLPARPAAQARTLARAEETGDNDKETYNDDYPVKKNSKEKELSIEPDTEEPAPAPARPTAALKTDPLQFFKATAAYAGRDLEMTMQMITTKKSGSGWRLNFVYTAPDKSIDYLYVDDKDVLGESPDLRIGYFYRVKFRCGRGDATDGNTLSSIEFTGEKATWATGLSAIE